MVRNTVQATSVTMSKYLRDMAIKIACTDKMQKPIQTRYYAYIFCVNNFIFNLNK